MAAEGGRVDESVNRPAKLRVPIALVVLALTSSVAASTSCGDDDGSGGAGGSGGHGGHGGHGGEADDGGGGSVGFGG